MYVYIFMHKNEVMDSRNFFSPNLARDVYFTPFSTTRSPLAPNGNDNWIY